MQDLEVLAMKQGAMAMLTSAKTGHNVENAFSALVDMILNPA
jgi:hypothetical protein